VPFDLQLLRSHRSVPDRFAEVSLCSTGEVWTLTDEGDPATAALRELDAALSTSISELTAARARVETVLAARVAGKAWRDIANSEERPLVVESVTAVLDRLSAVGSRFRRAQAHALHREGLSMERVASLFGVTRQRVSALLRDRETT